jgi:hypothetical protein
MMQLLEFKITDRIALEQFEKLLGFKIHGDKVRLPQDVYQRHANAITGIQMGAAFRLPR